MTKEIDIYKDKNFKGRDARLFMEWKKMNDYCSGNDKVSYIIRGRNASGLPTDYDIIFHIKSIVGVEESDEQGLQKPIFGDKHIMRITLPNEYPAYSGLPQFKFVTPVWHPNVRFFGDFKGRIDVCYPDRITITPLTYFVEKMIDYLTYNDYWAEDGYPYPEDLIVAEWIKKQAEPNGWLNFAQEENETQNNMEENLIELVLTYRGNSVLVETNPHNTIEQFLNETIQFAEASPEVSWNMPVLDYEGNPMYYFITRVNKDNPAETEILRPRNREKEEMTLFDYGVQEGDELMIQIRVIS